MTHVQRRHLANLLLLHGYDNLCEFWGELTQDAPDPSIYPTFDQAKPVLDAWCAHIIRLADKSKDLL